MKITLLMIACFMLQASIMAQDGSNDTMFNTEDDCLDGEKGFNAWVYDIAQRSSDKLIVAGEFTSFNGTPLGRIVGLNADGSLDEGFDTGTGFGSWVRSISLQQDGKIIAAGGFTTYNGVERNHIARLNADGTLDETFNPGSGFNVRTWTASIQDDGKIIVGGNFITFNGTSINRIARLNSDGTLDETFNPGTGIGGNVFATAIQPDGKILVGGGFSTVNGVQRSRIARLNSDGSLDETFASGTGFNATVYSIVVTSNGNIIVGGDFTSFNGVARNNIARLNTNGSLDESFNPGSGFNGSVSSTAVQQDGKIITTGSFTSFNGSTANRIARLNTDGSLDVTLDVGEGFNNSTHGLLIQSDGKIVVGGNFSSFDDICRTRIARLESAVLTVNELSNEAGFLNAFPNPNNGRFTLDTDLMGEKIVITDLLGNVITHGVINQKQTPIDISGAPSGMYLIRLKDKTIKFIKN